MFKYISIQLQVTKISVDNVKVAGPLGFAPTAAHKLAHPEAELATSRAAAANNIPMCLSTWSTSSLEDVVAQNLGNPYVMQVTFLRNLDVTQMVIRRAEGRFYCLSERVLKSLHLMMMQPPATKPFLLLSTYQF